MDKSGIDQDAIIAAFAQASARQGETLRKTVSEATLKALQGRELTVENIRKVLKSVTQAASAGAANAASAAEPMVRIEGLQKSFGDLEVLRDINLDVMPGQVVTIIGASNLARSLAADASALFARNLFNFLSAFWDKDQGRPVLPDDDEIVKAIRLTQGGRIVSERLAGSGA